MEVWSWSPSLTCRGMRPKGFGFIAALLVVTLVASPTVTSAWELDTSLDEDAEWEAVGELPGAERQGAILAALSLGVNTTNMSRESCVWRRGGELNAVCPDEDTALYLYTSPESRQRINISEADGLRAAGWEVDKHTVVLVHGYGGGETLLPMNILRDAYLAAGGYNVLMLDWSRLSRLPCYPAAVHNSVLAARCVGGLARLLRDSGARGDSWTCVGHSLGAHVCGIMADNVMFRVHKIIGLDPARPLIRPQNKHRLDAGDASVVHVVHTNAGHYGEVGHIGTADFCLNGGRQQPHCNAAKNVNLCSHLSSACFLADSIDGQSPLVAEPCGRRCPSARRAQSDATKQRLGFPASLGQHTPDSASGTFCATSKSEPFCQREPGGRGHPLCCMPRHNVHTPSTSTTTPTPNPAPSSTPATTDGPSTASTVATEVPARALTPTTETFKVGATITTEPPVTQHWERVEPLNATGHVAVTAPMPASVKASDPKVEVTVTASQELTLPDDINLDPVAPTTATTTTDVPSTLTVPGKDLTLITTSSRQPDSTLSPSEYLITALGLFPSSSKSTTASFDSSSTSPASSVITFPESRPGGDDFAGHVQQNANAATAAYNTASRWTPHFSAASGVHVVMPSNDSTMYTSPTPAEQSTESSVYAVYSTRAPPAPGPVVVIMANSDKGAQSNFDNIQDNLIENSSPLELPTTPVMDSTPFRPVSAAPIMDEAMAAMTEMAPPPVDPMFATFPFASPSSSPPPPEPAAPEDPAVIPAAGSPMGAWLPMVMLPPTPFSADSWQLRYRIPRPVPMRRTTYRNYVYER